MLTQIINKLSDIEARSLLIRKLNGLNGLNELIDFSHQQYLAKLDENDAFKANIEKNRIKCILNQTVVKFILIKFIFSFHKNKKDYSKLLGGTIV